jgi:hypothetical protein
VEEKEKQAIVEAALRQPPPQDAFRQAALKMLAEVDAQMLVAGVDPAIVAHMSAHAFSKIQGPSTMEIARSLIPIEPMPQGALPIYDRDPEVTDQVTPSEDDSDA